MRHLSLVFVLLLCCDARYVPEDGVYSVAETMPVYEPGISELKKYTQEKLAQSQYEKKGSVMVSFVIDTEGQMKDITVIKGINEECDQLAKEILMTAPGKWKPATNEGQPVAMKMVMPIKF